mmetsp:Transcript_103772/g.292697  ORF Transcript_103772/g.292697 Transcript_103772/m.292697 type:complete len:295 (+) Transcript_103772:864-1748(+)
MHVRRKRQRPMPSLARLPGVRALPVFRRGVASFIEVRNNVLRRLECIEDLGAKRLVRGRRQALLAPRVERRQGVLRGRRHPQLRRQELNNLLAHRHLGIRVSPQQRLRESGLAGATRIAGGDRLATTMHEPNRHDVVGEHHELLNQMVRHGRGGLLIHALDTAVGIDLERELAPLKGDRAASYAKLPARGCQISEGAEIRKDLRRHAAASSRGHLRAGVCGVLPRREQLVDGVVIQARARAYHGAAELRSLRVHQGAAGVEGKERGKRKTVAIGQQGAQVLAQPARQHRIDFPH